MAPMCHCAYKSQH